jgi:hypothetical protein
LAVAADRDEPAGRADRGGAGEAFLLSPASSGVTGTNLPVDAGYIGGTSWAAYGGLPDAPEA